jgi:hypothetical protein
MLMAEAGATRGWCMLKRLNLAFLALLMGMSVVWADITGNYQVQGLNPDGSTYSGTASVAKNGDTYRVTWVIAGTRFVGTGIGNDEALAVAYRSGNETGICLLAREGAGYGLVWAFAGGTRLGAEKWTRR